MSIDFRAAMRRAAEATRALDPAEATRLIREALRKEPAPGQEPPAPAAARRRPRPDVEEAEIVEPSAGDAGTASPRPGLGATIRSLRKGRAAARARPMPRPVPPAPLPPGARFESRSFAGQAGSRDYRLYVPAAAPAGINGLVVMLHGCTQTPEDFAAGTAMNAEAERRGLLVAYPAQTARHNPNACWNWFRPEDQRRGVGEPAILAGLAAAVAAEFSVPRDRIFAAGLSAGGAMAAVLGETYPDVFAAIGVHSGLPSGAAGDFASAFAAMRGTPRTGSAPRPGVAPRIIIFHGDADATVSPVNAGALVARAVTAAGPDVATERSDQAAAAGRHASRRTVTRRPDGTVVVELWMIEGAGHAWSGGDARGSYTDPSGPDASAEMVRFFIGG